MTCPRDFFLDYPADVWIETGSYLGDGVEKAIRAGYQKIISIELSEHYYTITNNRYLSNKDVNIVLGRSYEVLPKILADESISEKKILFWLDAHYSMCGTAGIDDPNPLLKELKVIKQWTEAAAVKLYPTIIVDDLRTFGKNTSGFDTNDIIDAIRSISSSYVFSFFHGCTGNHLTDPGHIVFNDDILVAHHQLAGAQCPEHY